jgi:hypothetical protein
MKRLSAALVAVSLLGMCGTAVAETTVKLTQMHICCGGCTKAIVAHEGSEFQRRSIKITKK